MQRLKQLVQSSSLSESQRIRIVQIGAHTGWDYNDPFIRGMTNLLSAMPQDFRQKYMEYIMVEASPQVFPSLQQSVQQHSHLCHFQTINAGIMPDNFVHNNNNNNNNTTTKNQTLTFYSIRDTVDVHSGRDSLSGRKLPAWATQIGSFDRNHLMKHNWAFLRRKLNIRNYIVETEIPVLSLSDLLTENTLFVLVDTEGFDCNIILGSRILPRFLQYEVMHCKKDKKEAAEQYLKEKGYNLSGQGKAKHGPENIVAVKA